MKWIQSRSDRRICLIIFFILSVVWEIACYAYIVFGMIRRRIWRIVPRQLKNEQSHTIKNMFLIQA